MLWCPEALWWYPATLSKGVCRRQEKVTQLWWKVHSFLCTQPGWTILPKKVKMKKVDRRVIYFKHYQMETLRQPPRIWKGFYAWFWKCLTSDGNDDDIRQPVDLFRWSGKGWWIWLGWRVILFCPRVMWPFCDREVRRPTMWILCALCNCDVVW